MSNPFLTQVKVGSITYDLADANIRERFLGGTLGTREVATGEYNSSNTYTVGNHCTNDSQEYVCTTDISTAGQWNSNYWASIYGTNSIALGINSTASGIASVSEGNDTDALGNYSHAEGNNSIASGAGSHAEGYMTKANKSYSHAEGRRTAASGDDSHAEGSGTIASSASSHSEGYNTTASGNASHAEGYSTTASGYYSHAEGGGLTTASGIESHAEGDGTTASGSYSHAQNIGTIAASSSQTALGKYNTSDSENTYAIILGNGTADNARSNALTVDWNSEVKLIGKNIDDYTIANPSLFEIYHPLEEGSSKLELITHLSYDYYTLGKRKRRTNENYNTEKTYIKDDYVKYSNEEYICISGTSGTWDSSHWRTLAYSDSYSYQVGDWVVYNNEEYICTSATSGTWDSSHWITIIGSRSFAEGEMTTASGDNSHAEGRKTIAIGTDSHAEGYFATASGIYSHAEGYNTAASGNSSHAEGYNTTASGNFSHAEGQDTEASGNRSHAEGSNTTASGNYSHAQNKYTIAASEAQTALGKYNIEDNAGTYAIILGNGTANNARSNALTVNWNGNIVTDGTINSGSITTDGDINVKKSSPSVGVESTGNNQYKITFQADSSTGYRGIYDNTLASWIIYRNQNDATVQIPNLALATMSSPGAMSANDKKKLNTYAYSGTSNRATGHWRFVNQGGLGIRFTFNPDSGNLAASYTLDNGSSWSTPQALTTFDMSGVIFPAQ